MGLPKDSDSYGLIHYDIHPWNFIIDGEKINVFDFDDSLYGWFALDIGIALYHGLWWGRKNDAGHDFSNEIIKYFLRRYLSANPQMFLQLTKISCKKVVSRNSAILRKSFIYTVFQHDGMKIFKKL